MRKLLLTNLILIAWIVLPGFVRAEYLAPDNGAGTVDLPGESLYVTPDGDLHIIDGLPSGTTIDIDGTLGSFFNWSEIGEYATGTTQQFQGILSLPMLGRGGLEGYERNLSIQVQNETYTGPRNPGDPVQSFDTDMVRLQGQLPPGDPDFDLLRITAGTGLGLPSPGHTTLTQLPGGNWAVDSFFDITYRIDFVGAPGGPLAGRSGSTTGTVRFTGEPLPEPATMTLLLLGTLGMTFRAIRHGCQSRKSLE